MPKLWWAVLIWSAVLHISAGQVYPVMVNSDADTPQANITACTASYPTYQCNLRSAWATCNSLSNSTVSLCSIGTLGKRSMDFNSTFGPLVLSSTAPAVSINGNQSTVTCRDCGVLLSSLPGFPFVTGNLTNTNSGKTNSPNISMNACKGSQLDLSSCNRTVGDSYLRLYSAAQVLVASSDNACSQASRIVYTATADGCQQYTLVMGCSGNTTCSMTVVGVVRKVKSYLTFLQASGIAASSSRVPTLTLSSLSLNKMTMVMYVNGNVNLSMSNVSVTNVKNDNSTALALTNLARGQVSIFGCRFFGITGSLGAAIYLNSSNVPVSITNTVFQNCSAVYGGAVYMGTQVHQVSLTSTVFQYCSAKNQGGAIFAAVLNSNITMNTVAFLSCSSLDRGGAAYFSTYNQHISITNSLFQSCTSGRGGALVYDANNKYLTIAGTAFRYCRATVNAGAVYILTNNVQITVKDSSFLSCTANTASGRGGGLMFFTANDRVLVSNVTFKGGQGYMASGIELTTLNTNFLIANCSFLSSSATSSGAGLQVQVLNRNITVDHCTFSRLSATYGAGINVLDNNRNIKVINSAFTGSKAASLGGGIYFNTNNTRLLVSNTVFSGCNTSSSGGAGGAIYFSTGNQYFTITDSLITGGYSIYGAGIYFGAKNKNILVSRVIFQRSSTAFGGGVDFYQNNTNIRVEDSQFLSLTSINYGGGMHFDSGAVNISISNSSFVNCSATVYGGGIYFETARTVSITDSQFIGCRTKTYDGAGVSFKNSNRDVYIANLQFVGGYSQRNGAGIAIKSYNANFYVLNCSFLSQFAVANGVGMDFYSYNTNITVLDSHFANLRTSTVSAGAGINFGSNNTRIAIRNNYFANSTSSYYGGGISFAGNTKYLALTKNIFLNCTSGSGGAVYMTDVNKYLDIGFNSFVGCTTRYDGGAVRFGSFNAFASLHDNTMVRCTGQQSGAVYVDEYNQNFTFSNNNFTDCRGAYGGGLRLMNYNQYFSFSNEIFTRCSGVPGGVSPVGGGGGLSLATGNQFITISNCVFYKCIAYGGGGGGLILIDSNNRVTVSHCSFTQCTDAIYQGGGIYIVNLNTELSFTNVTLTGCSAKYGGAMAIGTSNSQTSLNRVAISDSHAVKDGGGVFIDQSNTFAVMRLTTFTNNSAAGSGGAIYVNANNSNIMLGGCALTSNTATKGGGLAVFDSNTQVVVMDSTGLNSFKSIRMLPPMGGLTNTNSYTVPNGTDKVIVSFDKRTKIDPNANSVSISIKGRTLFTTYLNNFPGVQFPSLEINNPGPYISISYGYRFSSTLTRYDPNSIWGILVYFYPVVKRSVIATTPTVFDGNHATAGAGGGLYSYNYNTFMTMIHVNYFNNVASTSDGFGGGVYLWLGCSGLVMEKVTMANNYAEESGGAVAMISGNGGGLIASSQFINNSASGSGGSFMFGTSNGAGVYSQQNQIIIMNSTISASSAPQGGGVFMDNQNVVDFVRVSVSGNNATTGSGGGIYMNDANVVRFNLTTIDDNDAQSYGGGIALTLRNTINFNLSVVTNNQVVGIGGGLSVGSASEVVMTKSVLFANNKAGFGGGGIAVMQSPLWTLASTGGARLTVSGNQAGRGSALFFYELTQTNTSMRNVTMADNVASIGGTVFWLYEASAMSTEPAGLNSSSVIFSDNTVGYGEVATQGLRLWTPAEYEVTVFQGSLSPAITINMTDYYGQLVVSSNETSVSVSQLDTVAFNCSGRPASLSGTDLNGLGVVMQDGWAVFDALEAYCAPQGFSTVQFQVNVGSLLGVSASFQDLFSISNTSVFQFRPCDVGEYVSNGKCIVCQNGSYSLEAGVTVCTSCVGSSGVSACYGNDLVLTEGYWRRNTTNQAVLACLSSASCPGGTATGDASCGDGSEGPICAVCSDGYYMSSNACKECDVSEELSPQLVLLIVIISAVLVAFGASFVYRHFYVDINELKRNLAAALKSKSIELPQLNSLQLFYLWLRKTMKDTTVKVKIITSTYQVVIASSTVFAVSMPYSFTVFAGAFEFLNLDIYSMFPVGCSEDFNFMDELLWATLTPILLVTALAGFLVLAFVRLKFSAESSESLQAWETSKGGLLGFFFYITYLVLPSVSVKIFQTFICKNVDPDNEDPGSDDLYLSADMSISCTSVYYRSWVSYAIFMIFVYPIGIPLVYFLMLYFNREVIQNRYQVKDDADVSKQVAAALDDLAINPLQQRTPSVRQSAVKEVTPAAVIAAVNDKGEGEERPEAVAVDAAVSAKDKDKDKERAPSVAKRPKLQDIMYKLPPHVINMSFLWEAYQPQYWYWEVLETLRRIMLTSVLSVIAPGTSDQNVMSLILAFAFVKVYGYYLPYESPFHNMLTELGQAQIFFTYLVAMVSQNDLLSDAYTKAMGALLVLITISLPSLALYNTLQRYDADRRKAAEAAAAAEAAGEGDSSRPVSFMLRAQQSIGSLKIFGSSKGESEKPKPSLRRKSAYEVEAESQFQLAVSYQQKQRRASALAHMEPAIATDHMPTDCDVEMSVIRVQERKEDEGTANPIHGDPECMRSPSVIDSDDDDSDDEHTQTETKGNHA